MNNLLIILLAAGSAVVFLTGMLCIKAFHSALQLWQLTKKGMETMAAILKVEISNEPGRCIPFARLQVAFVTTDNKYLITVIESFFPEACLAALTADKHIFIRYNPANTSQIQIVKKQALQQQKTIAWQPVISRMANKNLTNRTRIKDDKKIS